MKERRAPLTANDLARICRVDLKTIHNWCGKGKIPHTRTSGGHLRFRRLDVIEFLRAYEYPIPESLRAPRALVCVVDADPSVHAAARRALVRRFEIVSVLDPIDALVELSAIDPEILVVDDAAGLDAARWIERLRALDRARHVRIVVFSARADRKEALLGAGASAFVARGDFAGLREALEELV